MVNGDLVSSLPSLYPLPLIDCRLDPYDIILNSIKGLIEKCKAISQGLSEIFLSYNNEPYVDTPCDGLNEEEDYMSYDNVLYFDESPLHTHVACESHVITQRDPTIVESCDC